MLLGITANTTADDVDLGDDLYTNRSLVSNGDRQPLPDFDSARSYFPVRSAASHRSE